MSPLARSAGEERRLRPAGGTRDGTGPAPLPAQPGTPAASSAAGFQLNLVIRCILFIYLILFFFFSKVNQEILIRLTAFLDYAVRG